MSAEERERFLQLEEEASRLRQEKADLLAKLLLERAKGEVFGQIVGILGTSHGPSDLAALTLRVVAKTLGVESGWALLRGDYGEAAAGMAAAASGAGSVQGPTPLCCLAAFGPHREALQGLTLEPGEGVAGWVATHGAAQVVEDPVKDPRFTAELGQRLGFEVHCILAAPIRPGGEPVGALELFNKDGGRFASADVEIAGAAADYMAGLLENARLLWQGERRAEQTLALTEVLVALTSVVEEEQTASALLESAARVTGAQAAAVLMADRRAEEFNVEAVLGEEAQSTTSLWRKVRDDIAAWVMEHGEVVWIGDIRSDQRWSPATGGEGRFPIASLIAAPVLVAGQVVGVVEVVNKQGGDRFSADDVRLLEALVRGAAGALWRLRGPAKMARGTPEAAAEEVGEELEGAAEEEMEE